MIDEAGLGELATGALASLGVERADAADTARILVLGDLFGHHTHGTSRVESYGERIRLGGIDPRARPAVETVAGAMAKVDGRNALGPVAGMRALETAMQLARAQGVGVALVRNSNHFGAAGAYCWLAAEAGFASIVASNASVTIAPTGGREAKLGNSPIAFGVPGDGGRHFVLDMALSVVARAKIRAAAARGSAIPDTWATDREGRPTTDPRAALDGFLLPIGGYKGYGLALAVDLFAGLLADASYLTHVNSWSEAPRAPGNLGHFLLAIDTRVLGSGEWLKERMQDFARILHDTPAADAAAPVRLPGELELDNLERQRREGIALEESALAKLRKQAGG
ncbi:MAG TPA: Ldh family oxidoreductase [Usitatibacter sp.]|nr:Ldh family oxidoreductase [Usitatibacter sp.]